MEKLIGQRLISEGLIKEEHIKKALERQRIYGGRIGHNLIALGFIKAEELEQFFNRYPESPSSIEATGLSLSFISDLIIKHVLFMGEFTMKEVSERVMLPISIVDVALQNLRREKFIEVKGATDYARVTYKFNITGQGRNRASELLDLCGYVGPAPVTIDDYRQMSEIQTVKNIIVDEENLKKAFSHLVISEDLLVRLGPAISSGKAIFLYGPPGNGKTAIAETIGRLLPGTIYIPHSIIIEDQIITIFDPINHETVPSKVNDFDKRWVHIKRPVIMTGGELVLSMLDLEFNPISKFYNAPLQMKANNGLLIIDDFGRQQIGPQDLLNRWIVPLERREDFLTLHTGMKFNIPFDQLIIFSTNIEPRKLVDEAFLRRIRYKIKIDHPTENEYESIFKKVCESNRIEFKKDVFDYLLNNYYKKLNIKLSACHPRDLIDHIIDAAHYYNISPCLTKECIDAAWKSYFVDI